MAAFDLVANMYDPALKPRLIRMLLREYVPDDKRAFNDPSALSMVVSMINIHDLLSESLSSKDKKLIDSWKSAVDSWVDRLFLLLSNDMPDKCWAGIILLGVTCQQCSCNRFLASYTEWFHKLLPHIQTDSQFLKVASCASISDLFSRLSKFQNAKKDGTSYAGKIIQPVLKLLHDENPEAVWDAAVHLLGTLIAFFPYSIHRHYDSAESAIILKVFSGRCSSNMLKKLSHCLASLPKSKGDEDTWSLLMQKVLLSINSHFNEAFQGIGENSKGNEVLRLLVPPGKDPPPLLGCNSLLEDSRESKSSQRLLISTVSTLMLCCSTMITSSYPHQVIVPIRPLLALIKRVLMVDGSLPPTSLPFMTTLQQESLCSELPTLHSNSLDLLIAIIKSLHSQLLPHAASIVRLIAMYLKKCISAELRVKVYAIAKSLMIAMGVGMAASLAQDVIDNALVDLNPAYIESSATSSVDLKDTQEEPLQHHKKRRRVLAATALQGQHDGHGSGGDVFSSHKPTPVALRIAALEALETLLTLAGALRCEGQRAEIDHALITAATSSFEGPCTADEISFRAYESTELWMDYQMAAFRALLASFLSAAHVRPLNLAQGLELFRKGKQDTKTKLADFCAHALLAMEVLLHPRVLTLSDYSSAHLISPEQAHFKIPENLFLGGLNASKPSMIGTLGSEQDMEQSVIETDDNLYERWVADDIEEVSVRNAGNEKNDDEMTNTISNNHEKEKNSANCPSSTETPARMDQDMAVVIPNVQVIDKDDNIVVNGSMNSSPVSLDSLDSGKKEDFEMDQNSNLLPEDDFPDIIDADPDSDYEV